MFFVAMIFFRNNVGNGDKRQQKSENLDRLEALYRHWEGLTISMEKQAEDFGRRLREERDRTDSQMRQLRKYCCFEWFIAL